MENVIVVTGASSGFGALAVRALAVKEYAATHDRLTQSYMDAIYRNALRIHKLTKDILDVTRIESNTLRLSKINFGLKEVILNAIEDTRLMLSPESNFDNNYLQIFGIKALEMST